MGKSASDSKSSRKYKLKTVLKRKPEFHELDTPDLKYLWAAYRLGSFGEADLSQEEFDDSILALANNVDIIYTLVAETKNGKIPVGIAQGDFVGPMFFMHTVQWFKWATDRNKTETVIHTLNELRKSYVVVIHNHMEYKKFYEFVSKHGVIRRVGQLFDIYEDCPAQVWQTRYR